MNVLLKAQLTDSQMRVLRGRWAFFPELSTDQSGDDGARLLRNNEPKNSQEVIQRLELCSCLSLPLLKRNHDSKLSNQISCGQSTKPPHRLLRNYDRTICELKSVIKTRVQSPVARFQHFLQILCGCENSIGGHFKRFALTAPWLLKTFCFF